MKWGAIFLVFISILAVAANFLVFKIKWFTFIGILLGVILFLSVAGILVFKFIQKKRGVSSGVEHSFIFPDKVADKMKKVDLGIQYEASVLSIAFLIVGIIAFDIYFVFITQASLAMKIFMAFNGVCGVVLMTSMLVTNYQQLVAYRESTKFITQFAQSNANMNKPKEDKKKKSFYPPLPNLDELPVQDEELPDGYYLGEDGRYYDYDGNEVMFEDPTHKNERRYMR